MKKLISIFGAIIILGLVGLGVWYGGESGTSNSVAECEQHDTSNPTFSKAKDVCYTNVARDTQNSDLCSQIKDESIKKLCFVHVFYWDKSVEYCMNDDQKNICLHVVSIKNKDKSICTEIDSDSIRKVCLQEE